MKTTDGAPAPPATSTAPATIRPGAAPPVGLRPATIVGAVVAFMLIGAQQALYGPAIPALRTTYDISAGAAGTALSVQFAGGILGVLAMPLARRRGLSDGTFLRVALALVALGCAGFLLAPTWPLALAAALLAGIGFGGIDGGVNQVFTERYADRGTAMLNLLHGCFGVGAIAGPIMIGLLPGYTWAFAGCALLAVVALPMLRGAVGAPAPAASERPTRPAVRTGIGLAYVVFFMLHVGLETGAGGWETTHLLAIGVPERGAASATSGFWLAFTAVRFVVVPLSRRLTARTIVIACTLLAVLASALTALDPLAPYAYGLLGVAVGPLFPTGLAWLGQTRPELIPTVVAVSMAGGIFFPPAIGLAVQAFDSTAIPVALAVLAAAAIVTVLLLARGQPRPKRVPVGR